MLTVQVLWNALIAGSLYALVTVGFALTYNIGNFFNMAHGAVFLVGAYTGYRTYRVFHLGLPFALILSALSAGVLGVILQRAVFQPLSERKAPGLVLFIASLGILSVTEGLITALCGNEIIIFWPGPSPSFDLLGGRMTILQGEILLLSAVLFVAMYVVFQRTDLGRRIRAVSDDRELAVALGISVKMILSRLFFWGSALAGVAGLLVGLEQSIRPGSGMKAILWAMVASIIGGVGSFTGPILGAFLLGVLENVAISFFPSEWKATIVFSTLIMFFFFRPMGIWGVKR